VESFDENQYACRKGEEGQSFFFILKGSESIYPNSLSKQKKKKILQILTLPKKKFKKTLTLFVKKISQCFLSGNPSAKWP
jgi:hypothetical protein